MALAVASTSYASANGSTSFAVTAPSGIQEDDLLLIVAFQKFATDNITSTGFTKSFAETYDVTGSTDDMNITVLYKVATTADESETNYTVSGSTNGMGAAVMLRVTGWSVALDPIFNYASGNVVIATSGGPFTATMTSAFSRPYQQLHIIAAGVADDLNFTGDITAGAYTLNSSDTNPTWTEVCDIGDTTHTTGTDYAALALAYATSTDTSAVTSYEVDYTEVSLGANAAGFAVGFTLLTPTDSSGSNTLATTTSTAFTHTGLTDGIASNTLATATSAAFSQAGTGQAGTQWTNESQVSTTWTNQDKV